jgi:hypothetical protein
MRRDNRGHAAYQKASHQELTEAHDISPEINHAFSSIASH